MRKLLRAKHGTERQGAIIVLVAVMMLILAASVAFAVDYSFLLKMRTDMQRAADASALAAVQTLAPSALGIQDVEATKVTLREYVQANLTLGDGFSIADADIEIGRYDPDLIYSVVSLRDDGIFDAVRVTLRRDGIVNPRVPLHFARVLGVSDSTLVVTATAVLQKPNALPPGAAVLPVGIPQELWESAEIGDRIYGYGDGKVEDEHGNEIPGNWGTVDIGDENNSTSDLGDQIENGLMQDDLDALHGDGRIDQDAHIDATEEIWLQADPGLSTGMKSAVKAIHGEERVVPIYGSLGGGTNNGGNNLEYGIVGWGVVTVVDSNWKGAKNTWIELQRSYMYSGNLTAQPNSLGDPPAIEGAYGAPVLVE